ncbi:MAG: dihydroneopterin aldolase [Flavobacteriaceae bacterium]
MIIFADRMGKIFVKNIRLYAYHGCLEEESKIGSDYLVNLTVETDLEKSSGTDDLKDTVDYEALHALAKEEMSKREKLLETVVFRLAKKILKQHREVSTAIVKVAKLNPPIGGNVEEVAVEIELSRSSLDFGE